MICLNRLFAQCLLGFTICIFASSARAEQSHGCQATVNCQKGIATCGSDVGSEASQCGQLDSGKVKFCKSWLQSKWVANFICCDSHGNAFSFKDSSSGDGIPKINETCQSAP